MTQVLARTEEYKKELVAKRKQLEEIQAAQASPAD
jgi:BMFP domain-containing protein YqiC